MDFGGNVSSSFFREDATNLLHVHETEVAGAFWRRQGGQKFAELLLFQWGGRLVGEWWMVVNDDSDYYAHHYDCDDFHWKDVVQLYLII